MYQKFRMKGMDSSESSEEETPGGEEKEEGTTDMGGDDLAAQDIDIELAKQDQDAPERSPSPSSNEK